MTTPLQPEASSTAIIAHDAGGAEILASYAAKHPGNWTYVLAGPGIKVFQRRLSQFENSTLDFALDRCESFLCGTGWQSEWEWFALKRARECGKRTIAYIDHWVNYPQRFIRNGTKVLPDEIWVGDGMAEQIAKSSFPHVPVHLVPNPYLEDVKRTLMTEKRKAPHSPAGLKVLFVCENIRDSAREMYGDERYHGYTEDDAIRYFMSNLDQLGGDVIEVVIRPHPADPEGKYDWIEREYPERTLRGGRAPLLSEIVDSDVVAGCGSMAMVVALAAGKRVVCCIPPGGRACLLPHPEIENMISFKGRG